MKISKMWGSGLVIAFSVTIILALIYGYLQLLGLLANTALNTPEMLQSMIQAEATILGFLGVVAAYVLTSYDTRIDRLEQQHFDLEQQCIDKETSNTIALQVTTLKNRLEKTRSSKKDALITVASSSAFLILSLLLSITTLGIRNEILGGAGFYLFFGGISNAVFLFYQISKDTG